MGFGALLSLGGSWRVGGSGLFMPSPVTLEGTSPFRGSDLRMGYGGLVLERVRGAAPDDGPRVRWTGRVLLGAGNAEVASPVAGTRLRADNFLVLEPTLALEAPLVRPAAVGALVGWRVVSGVDDLAGVRAGDLGGWTAGLLLRLGPF